MASPHYQKALFWPCSMLEDLDCLIKKVLSANRAVRRRCALSLSTLSLSFALNHIVIHRSRITIPKTWDLNSPEGQNQHFLTNKFKLYIYFVRAQMIKLKGNDAGYELDNTRATRLVTVSSTTVMTTPPHTTKYWKQYIFYIPPKILFLVFIGGSGGNKLSCD